MYFGEPLQGTVRQAFQVATNLGVRVSFHQPDPLTPLLQVTIIGSKGKREMYKRYLQGAVAAFTQLQFIERRFCRWF